VRGSPRRCKCPEGIAPFVRSQSCFLFAPPGLKQFSFAHGFAPWAAFLRHVAAKHLRCLPAKDHAHSSPNRRFITQLYVGEEGHEAEVHVELLVAVEEG
jgi:hypothetical protein